MRVQCDVCGGEPAAVLCCADEAALCAACDRRVHRANKLAGQHRRLQLVNPDSGPLCDVCKERAGLVFCVEDRAILCADCDDPIHSANDLTARHTRFLLVGAKLSAAAALVDQEQNPSPDRVGPGTACAVQDAASKDRSSVLDCSSNNAAPAPAPAPAPASSSISDYLTSICPGWRVDDLLLDDAAFGVTEAERDGHEQVPSLDADLFDVVAGRPGKRRAWAGATEEVPAAMAAPVAAKPGKQQRERYGHNDSDVFAVPEISPPPAKKARMPPPSFWCF